MVSKRRRVLGFGHGKLLASRAEEETDGRSVVWQFGGAIVWACVPALPLPSHVTWGRLQSHNVPQFSQL